MTCCLLPCLLVPTYLALSDYRKRWMIPLFRSRSKLRYCADDADRGPACYNTDCSRWHVQNICLLFLFCLVTPHSSLQHGGWTKPLYSGRFAGLYHSADCIECGIESNCLSLSRLHVGVIHRVFKWCLSVGALMADIAIELDLGTCPGKREKWHCVNDKSLVWKIYVIYISKLVFNVW